VALWLNGRPRVIRSSVFFRGSSLNGPEKSARIGSGPAQNGAAAGGSCEAGHSSWTDACCLLSTPSTAFRAEHPSTTLGVSYTHSLGLARVVKAQKRTLICTTAVNVSVPA